MSSTDFFWALGDVFEWTFQIFEIIGNMFNDFLLILGFLGMFYWLAKQHKFNKEAASNPDQLK